MLDTIIDRANDYAASFTRPQVIGCAAAHVAISAALVGGLALVDATPTGPIAFAAVVWFTLSFLVVGFDVMAYLYDEDFPAPLAVLAGVSAALTVPAVIDMLAGGGIVSTAWGVATVPAILGGLFWVVVMGL